MKARWWAAAVAAAMLASGGIAVCWRGWGAGAAAAPDRQQDLVFWLGDEPSPLDPGLTGDQWAVDLLNAVEEGLMRADADLKPKPALAQRVDVSPDNTTFTFHLRQALWSDGKPLTAEDFRYAWLRVLDPASRAPFAYLFYPIKGAQEYHEGKAGREQVAIEVPDERTLRVTLGAPTPCFLSLTTLPVYFPVRRDVAEAAGQAFGTDPNKMVSIGPFRLTNWEHGQQLVVKKNDTYWDARHVRLTSVTFRIVKDVDTRVRLYEAGDLDQTGAAGSQMAVWKGRPDSIDTPEASVFFLVFNPDRYLPFQNKNVRLAFSYALDRAQYVEAIWRGTASPAYGLVPPPIPGRQRTFREENGDLFVDRQDEAARALLRAGLRELHMDALPPISLLVEDSSEIGRTAEWLCDQWRKNLGVNVQIDRVSHSERLNRQKEANYQLALAGWGADYNDALTFLSLWVTGDPNNLVHYHNPNFDDLVASAATAGDPALRAQKLEQAERVLLQEMPVAPLFFRHRIWLQKPYVKGVLYHPLGPDWDLKEAYIQGKGH